MVHVELVGTESMDGSNLRQEKKASANSDLHGTSESKEDSSSMEEEVALLRLRVVVLQSQLEGLMMGGARPEGISGLKQNVMTCN